METYSKPEITALGDAAVLIQSSKPHFGENGNITVPNALSAELE
jgi:hypothetical protein